MIAKVMAIHQVVIAVNKMDDHTVKFSEERFNEIKNYVTTNLMSKMYTHRSYSFIPISGYEGDNLTSPSENMPWYKGPTLLRALENLRPPKREHLIKRPLRIPIRDVFRIGGIGTVPVGRVETGTLKAGMRVTIAPYNLTTEVKDIEIH